MKFNSVSQTCSMSRFNDSNCLKLPGPDTSLSQLGFIMNAIEANTRPITAKETILFDLMPRKLIKTCLG